MKLTIFIVLLIIIQVISITNGKVIKQDENIFNQISPELNDQIKSLLNNYNISFEDDINTLYNISKSKHYTQVQLLENDRVLGFFLDKLRDYFSDNGFDVIKFEQFVKTLCNTLFICKIPVIGNISNFIIDGAGILLEAQCYRDYAENLPTKGGIQLTSLSIPKIL